MENTIEQVFINKYNINNFKILYWSCKKSKNSEHDIEYFTKNMSILYNISGYKNNIQYSMFIFKDKYDKNTLDKLSNDIEWIIISEIECNMIINQIKNNCSNISIIGKIPKKTKKQTQKELLFSMIKYGYNEQEIFKLYPFEYNSNKNFCIDMIESYMMNEMKKPKPIVIYLYGDTGVGKSYSIRNKYQDDLYTVDVVYNKQKKDIYFNGYFYHPVVLFDDFDDSSISINNILKIIDEYPILVQRQRRTSIKFIPQIIIFTSNVKPDELYKKSDKRKREAFIRRITKTIHMKMRRRKNIYNDLPNIKNKNIKKNE